MHQHIDIENVVKESCQGIGLSDDVLARITTLESDSLKKNITNASNDLSLTIDEREAMNKLLLEIKEDAILRLHNMPTLKKPTADVVTGGPGTGKSVVSKQHMISQHATYLCGDEIKKTFKELAKLNPVLSKKDKFMNDAYLHRITSKVNWELVDYCIENRKSFVLEMLGTHVQGDVKMLNDLVKSGYEVSYSHVCTPSHECSENIVRRFLGDSVDGGRYVSILKAREELFLSNEAYAEAMSLISPKIKTMLFNNSKRSMTKISEDKLAIVNFIAKEDKKPDVKLNLKVDVWQVGQQSRFETKKLFNHIESEMPLIEMTH